MPWADYEAMLRIVVDRHIRINYNRGRMEIMSPLRHHGDGSNLLARMVNTLTEELNLACHVGRPGDTPPPRPGEGSPAGRPSHHRIRGDHAEHQRVQVRQRGISDRVNGRALDQNQEVRKPKLPHATIAAASK